MEVARVLAFEAPDLIVDHIFLGGEGSTIKEQWLKEHNISRVLTVAAHMERMVKFSGIVYLALDVDDDPKDGPRLRSHLRKALDFMDSTPTGFPWHFCHDMAYY